MRYFIAIPTYNGGKIWEKSASEIKKYAPNDALVHVIDSESKDDTVNIAKQNGFDVQIIPGSEFNHGGTRNRAIDNFKDYDIVIFLTQDAIPEMHFIENIIQAFDDPNVACAYGRQLPHEGANSLAKHARSFNYSSHGYVCGKENIPEMGIKTVFMSNSFSAYRLSIFQELGGFPSNTILCEDMYYAAKAVLAGYKIAYVPSAIVYHSHNYTPIEEFKRYFDIGVFHTDEQWIREKFGTAGGEGKKFIISELRYLIDKNKWMIVPLAMINNFMKFMGYELGKRYRHIPKSLVRLCSMHKRFWNITS
ncbi:TPA: glycosyltransferase family 2 protein [Klebsiella pneumoniae]|nr:glycosyltransferase family 2 protein [Klebsiella pneumoniae]HBY7327430.1 glycosyltransferase family 2 protein [Klebsiella pneumoniae]